MLGDEAEGAHPSVTRVGLPLPVGCVPHELTNDHSPDGDYIDAYNVKRVIQICAVDRDSALIKVQTPHGEKVGSCSLEELRQMPGVGTAKNGINIPPGYKALI